MDFAEVDRRYEELKEQHQAGALTEEQFDDQLLDMMVRDDENRWWAKARESGDWHYHDQATGDWVRADPPSRKPDVNPPAAPPTRASPQSASPQTTKAQSQTANMQTVSQQTNAASRPTWAAVVPPAAATALVQPTSGAAQSAPDATRPGGTSGAATQPQASAPYSASARDFAPLPELAGGMKIIFYLLAFFIPVVGIILFFVYRKKPAAPDRAAARICLILGIISLVLAGLCGSTLVFAEMIVASLLQN
jgi:hypothetical protein